MNYISLCNILLQCHSLTVIDTEWLTQCQWKDNHNIHIKISSLLDLDPPRSDTILVSRPIVQSVRQWLSEYTVFHYLSMMMIAYHIHIAYTWWWYSYHSSCVAQLKVWALNFHALAPISAGHLTCIRGIDTPGCCCRQFVNFVCGCRRVFGSLYPHPSIQNSYQSSPLYHLYMWF